MMNCLQCGKELGPRRKKYCSKQCTYIALQLERNPNWKPRVKLKIAKLSPLRQEDITKDVVRDILARIVEQAAKDFQHGTSLGYCKQEDFETAVDFIFDDNYCIDYGSQILNLQDILEYLYDGEITIEGFRSGCLRGQERYEQINSQMVL